MKSKAAYAAGEIIGGTPYKVLRVIGAGGMGTVYDTEDVSVGKRYVVKTLHAELAPRADLERMMQQEGRALARVQHPHIVDVITAGKTRDRYGLPYIVMEYLDGATLRAVASSVSLSHEDVLKVATELLEALYHMHQGDPDPVRGRPPILHRDIKPENIFLARAPDGGHIVKLLDLGIAVLLDGQAHGACGTPKYMAPEQFRGEPLSPQTDLYQVACVFFELLTGRHPFATATTTQQLIQAHLNVTPARVSTMVKVGRRVDDVIAAALSKSAGERPRDAYAFMVAMRDLRDGPGMRAPVQANTTLEDLKTAIERHTESGYEAYATAEGTLEDPLPPFVMASTARAGAARNNGDRRGDTARADLPPNGHAAGAAAKNGTVPMAHAAVAGAGAQAPSREVSTNGVDRTAATRSYREPPALRGAGANGTEELLDGLGGAPQVIAELRRGARARVQAQAPVVAPSEAHEQAPARSSRVPLLVATVDQAAVASRPALPAETPLAAAVQTRSASSTLDGERPVASFFSLPRVVAFAAVAVAVAAIVTRSPSIASPSSSPPRAAAVTSPVAAVAGDQAPQRQAAASGTSELPRPAAPALPAIVALTPGVTGAGGVSADAPASPSAAVSSPVAKSSGTRRGSTPVATTPTATPGAATSALARSAPPGKAATSATAVTAPSPARSATSKPEDAADKTFVRTLE